MLAILPTTLRLLLGSLLWANDLHHPSRMSFQLRHQHAVTNSSRVIFSDVHDSDLVAHSMVSADPYVYTLRASRLNTHKPSSLSAFHDARLRSMRHAQSDASLWEGTEVIGPNVTDRETLLALAKMTNNAYLAGRDSGWYDIEGFNTIAFGQSIPVGWEPSADGLRGHIFVSTDNTTVILSIKGTSAGWITGGGGPTVRKDKLNDNLMFSCCCARVGPTWSTVCDCYKGSGKCSNACVETSLLDEELFYSIGLNLYNNITYMYPHANIWVIGHSLGGAVSSLLGATFGAPVVAFEAPAEKLAATRLHLPSPPSTHHITHIIHTADPIAMGTCNGVTSTCALAGYAMETRCHLGQVALYDVVSKLGWTVDIRTHSIVNVIERLLAQEFEWDDEPLEDDDTARGVVDQGGLLSYLRWGWWGGRGDGDDKGKNKTVRRPVPEAKPEVDCVDCFNWEYGEWDD
ncbi:Alpha/Beta hydrolase protein [Pisolithus marmoratus]|nr:Alpha/Beta hydrolase protein [Pisolithus marmoratus]